MRITVLLFAGIAESVGSDRLAIDVREDASVADALDRLAAEHESIARARGTLALAVDEAYAPLNAVLREGSTLALIPPVSGG